MCLIYVQFLQIRFSSTPIYHGFGGREIDSVNQDCNILEFPTVYAM